MEQLTYDDLKLGEKAKEAYLDGKSTAGLPVYLNTRPAFANLNVTDLAIAAVLAGLNILLVGDTGSGKTQLAKDIYNHYFNGNKADGGNGVFVRGRPDLDVYTEIFTQLNMEKAQRVLTGNIDSLVYMVDELNRCPPVAQNQFFGMGDGVMDYLGRAIQIGRNNYHVLIATANIGNGEFQGTFKTDKAMYNRAHVAIDFDYEMFKPTRNDEMTIDMMIAANPNVKESIRRDLTGKILAASKEIEEIAQNPGIEALAVVNYLRFGLETCMEHSTKEKIWPMECQECGHSKKKKDDASAGLCSLVRAPVRRTINAMIKYASAMQWLAHLKNPQQPISVSDLMFKAFELTGAYQQILNPMVLKMEYRDQNPKMMADVAGALKADYKKYEEVMSLSLEGAERKGMSITAFFRNSGKIGIYDEMKDDKRKKFAKEEPYTDDRVIGMGWMKDYIKQILKQRKE